MKRRPMEEQEKNDQVQTIDPELSPEEELTSGGGELTAPISESTLSIDPQDHIDLTGLPQEEINGLKSMYAKGMIDLKTKAAELNIETAALDAALASFTEQTAKASQSGSSATITHTQSSSVGRTEVVIGNTNRAATGRLTRSAAGELDRTIWIIAMCLGAFILATLIIKG